LLLNKRFNLDLNAFTGTLNELNAFTGTLNELNVFTGTLNELNVFTGTLNELNDVRNQNAVTSTTLRSAIPLNIQSEISQSPSHPSAQLTG